MAGFFDCCSQEKKRYSYFLYALSGANLRIFRGGGDFQKKIGKFCRPFFVTNSFSELSQIIIKTLDWPIFLRCRQFFQRNRPKRAFLSIFLENLDQKIAFFRRALPLKIVKIGTECAFRKNFRSVNQKWISQNSTKGTLWVGRCSNPWGWGVTDQFTRVV